ncbi:MAG TPA: non-canonical purine NTP pyrophosphatase [Gaiellaceae bacterium]|nr:non-canonical purine NTP pyrophosphatase [Gaiellaceae bacterium]
MAAVTAFLASRNRNKLEELRTGLRGWRLEPVAAADWPPETGRTYEENARAKARFARSLAPADAWALGEDSGIECEALGGEPGLHSARWAAGRDEADALLERLAGEPDRRARMVSELVALGPAGEELHARGVLEGAVATGRRGTGGFGYDPVFIPAGHDRTVAELGDAWKRVHSHRALAASALLEAIRSAGAS